MSIYEILQLLLWKYIELRQKICYNIINCVIGVDCDYSGNIEYMINSEKITAIMLKTDTI